MRFEKQIDALNIKVHLTDEEKKLIAQVEEEERQAALKLIRALKKLYCKVNETKIEYKND